MPIVVASTALYIKLGRSGEWEDKCVGEGTLRFGYPDTPHEWCLAGKWDKVLEERQQSRGDQGVASSDVKQIQYFYEADGMVLWVTFYKHALWWCFSNPVVNQLADGSKLRTAVNGWKNTDALGQPLLMSSLSGKLLSMQGYRGTICRVKEQNYLLNRLNAEDRPEVARAKSALKQLHVDIESVIQSLSWRDFEILVDLIYREGGWKRVGAVGSTVKSIDLDLISPITAERCGVQVKSKSDRRLFESYRESRLADMEGFARFHFVVHSPSIDLRELTTRHDDQVCLLLPTDIARLAVSYGLASWIIDKAG